MKNLNLEKMINLGRANKGHFYGFHQNDKDFKKALYTNSNVMLLLGKSFDDTVNPAVFFQLCVDYIKNKEKYFVLLNPNQSNFLMNFHINNLFVLNDQSFLNSIDYFLKEYFDKIKDIIDDITIVLHADEKYLENNVVLSDFIKNFPKDKHKLILISNLINEDCLSKETLNKIFIMSYRIDSWGKSVYALNHGKASLLRPAKHDKIFFIKDKKKPHKSIHMTEDLIKDLFINSEFKYSGSNFPKDLRDLNNEINKKIFLEALRT